MTVPFFSGADVERAVSPLEAYRAVRAAFVAHARGEWTMQPKLYVTNYPAGDFRAMPALGGGHALLKWVTSFPGNPARGLPTVTGLVLLSSADTGQLEAVLDAAAVTALRTAAAGAIAAEALGRPGAESTAVVGCGVNGAATVRMFRALGADVLVWDIDPARAAAVAGSLGARVASSREQALACDRVVTVTPGREVLFPEGSLRESQHVSLMGADGPGKAEVAVAELARARLFCDDWEQASHGGELAAAVVATGLTRERVTELGRVLTNDADGRRFAEEIKHLLHEERVPVGRLEDRAGDTLRHGLSVEQGLQERFRLALAERRQHDRGGVDASGAPRGSRAHELGSRKADDQDGTVVERTEDVVDEVEEWLGSPVDVLDQQHHEALAPERGQVVRPGLMERLPDVATAREAARAVGQRQPDRPGHAAQHLRHLLRSHRLLDGRCSSTVRLDGARDPGPGDRDRGVLEGRRARPADDRPLDAMAVE